MEKSDVTQNSKWKDSSSFLFTFSLASLSTLLTFSIRFVVVFSLSYVCLFLSFSRRHSRTAALHMDTLYTRTLFLYVYAKAISVERKLIETAKRKMSTATAMMSKEPAKKLQRIMNIWKKKWAKERHIYTQAKTQKICTKQWERERQRKKSMPLSHYSNWTISKLTQDDNDEYTLFSCFKTCRVA